MEKGQSLAFLSRHQRWIEARPRNKNGVRQVSSICWPSVTNGKVYLQDSLGTNNFAIVNSIVMHLGDLHAMMLSMVIFEETFFWGGGMKQIQWTIFNEEGVTASQLHIFLL